MIISPPFLPANGLTSDDPLKPDPMMDAVDGFELPHHGVYPVAFDRRWHCGVHLMPNYQNEAVRAIADGEVVAYRVAQKAICDGQTDDHGADALNSNTGFVLLKHKTETGEGRSLTFYSLYMHLLDVDSLQPVIGAPNLPEVGSSSAMAKWLADDTNGVQTPVNKKVYRKDILGYYGKCHGQSHLHFEIFMTEEDFTAWFDQIGHTVQLGNQTPATPDSKDYWGHSYFVIPTGQTFYSTPPDQVAHAAYFPEKQSGILTEGNLYVEAYFHKGQRYTRSWLEKDGSLTCLTGDQPVQDPFQNYEYTLYDRATTLYPARPSDGYELMRFGRILSDHSSLPVAPQTTWMAVTFESGKQGYIDISQDAVQKLSDADFPFFMGWQKIEEGNTPFSEDGLCDYDALRKIVNDVEDQETPQQQHEATEYKHEDILSAYVQGNDSVRKALRGFVCLAPSEWDATGNEVRYRRLKDPDGFFGKRKDIDPNGYDKFIAFHTQLQFLEKTALGGGKKFWFFHPLAFIGHFRKCSWLAKREIYQLVPAKIVRKPGSHNFPSQSYFETVPLNRPFINKHYTELNNALRKYLITSSIRQACFFGNSTQETGWFRDLRESGGATPNLHAGWYGRGFLQLTNPNGNLNGGNNNYYKYFKFMGRHPETPANVQEIAWRDELGVNSFHASQSAGAYWIWSKKSAPTEQNPNRPQVDSANTYADDVAIVMGNQRRTVNTDHGPKIWYYNQLFTNCATAVNYPGATGQNPPNMNGLIDRSTSFANAVVILCDGHPFPAQDGAQNLTPEIFERRSDL
ncbi:hypothetical protein [Cupriavidus basilensis]|uniref:hypothetical protein n=1 Tax=Cupriavidus basilensis TaxID=68895 RepID=UPI0009E2AC2D|nr:hypothetical protein [Cupriavidus basilensis]